MRNIIVKEYIESLKEDNELDYIFTLLLVNMKFRVVSTPRNSKGQIQYGKDVVAIGKDKNGKEWKWYFEIKGYAAKDIDERNFCSPDGIRDSLLAAKDVDFSCYTIPGFMDLPTKYVVVHNGIIKQNANFRFEQFVNKNFEEGTVERWGIEKLTELFSTYLFDECLFSDNGSYSLMKKILVLLDAPSNDFSNICKIIDLQIQKYQESKGKKRQLCKLFSSLSLINLLVYRYSEDYEYLTPSKYCIDYTLLKSWAFILEKQLYKRKLILDSYNKLLNLQICIYNSYLTRTFPLAAVHKGLYTYGQSDTEPICYPLRCFDYLSDVLYHSLVIETYCEPEMRSTQRRKNLDAIKVLITANSGFDMLLLDTQSIPFLYLFYYILNFDHNDDDLQFLLDYTARVVQNIVIVYKKKGMLPEVYGNRIALARSLYEKDESYCDKSSTLILHLAEIVAWFDCVELYQMLRNLVKLSDVNLQVTYPVQNENIEVLLFERNLHNYLAVESSITLPNTIEEFKTSFKKHCKTVSFITDNKYPCLRMLAHMFYQTDIFPTDLDWGNVEYQ